MRLSGGQSLADGSPLVSSTYGIIDTMVPYGLFVFADMVSPSFVIEIYIGVWYNQFDKLEFNKDVIFMKLVNAELENIERIVAISKAAFDSEQTPHPVSLHNNPALYKKHLF